jgi:hypothetical protein
LVNRYSLCKIPSHPSVLAEIKRELDQATNRDPNINKIDFLKSLRIEPGYNPLGRDYPARPKTDAVMEGRIEMERVDLPPFKPTGDINALVVLIDFNDNAHTISPDHHSEMLFSKGTILTGSLRDYFQTVSNKKVNIIGQVSGWHRMSRAFHNVYALLIR